MPPRYSRWIAALVLLPTLLLAQNKNDIVRPAANLNITPPLPTPTPSPVPTQVPVPTPAPTQAPVVASPTKVPRPTIASTPTPTSAPTGTPTPTLIHAYPAANEIKIPWKDGEALTYHAYWGIVDAADGTFTTHSDGNKWSCTLALQSAGSVSTIYPFKDYFTTSINKSPWRSLSYTEDRHEPGRVATDITEVNYTHTSAARLLVNKSKGTTENHDFTFTTDALDDLGSMLLHLRAMHWSVGEKHMLYVYENNSAKEGEATCEAIETKAFGTWPSQSLIRVHAVPGKGTHRHGYLTFWMTNDSRRLPLHADLNFYYGTFSIDLTKVDIVAKSKTPPPTP